MLHAALSITLCSLILTVAISVVLPEAAFVAGALTILAAIIGLLVVRGMQLAISLVLITVGLAGFFLGLALGGRPTIAVLLAVNQDLIAMMAAVSFVQLVASSPEAAKTRLTGARAVWRTAGAVHLLGSVINISAINIVGDKLGMGRPLSRVNELLLSRAFSAGAFWSPFWGATAAAIAYAPGAKENVLIACGLCLAVIALAYSITGVVRRFQTEIIDYHGYVLSWRGLRIPVSLVLLVVALNGLLPDIPIPRLVLVSSIAMTVVVLFILQPRSAFQSLVSQARFGLPRLSGELTLFASAGILAIGLGFFFSVVNVELPISEFTVTGAWLITIAMSLLSLVGVHPVISIAAVAALLAPLEPNATLFAMAGMIAWGASSAAGPISGLNIYLYGRFGANNFAIARANLLYLAFVLALAWPVLWLSEQLS